MKLYTYENSFHNTRTRSTLSPEERDELAYQIYANPHTVSRAERERYNRIDRMLCGIKDCQCGPFTKCTEEPTA